MKPLLSLRSMSRRGTVNLWLFIITGITGPLFYLMSPKLWSFALVSWALVCVTPIAVAMLLIPIISGVLREACAMRCNSVAVCLP